MKKEPQQLIEHSDLPQTGGMLRTRRQEHGWSVSLVVCVYNEMMEGEHPLSERGLYYLEAENKPLHPLSRRAMLSAILGFLGPCIHPSPFPFFLTTIGAPLSRDLQDVQLQLPYYWQCGIRPHTAERIFQELASTLASLEQAALYGRQKSLARTLLCQYSIVSANLLRDFGSPKQALVLLRKALILSRELDKPVLQAEAAYIQGFCLLDVRDHHEADQREHDLRAACRAFRQAYQMIARQGEIPPLRTAIFAEFGVTQAYLAQTPDERKQAFKLIEVGARAASTQSRHPLFLDVNQEWCQIDLLEALLATSQPKQMLEQMSDLIGYRDPAQKRRYTFLTILEAEAYLQQGTIDLAVASFLSALSSGILSQTHALRIQKSLSMMRQHPIYQRSIESARLSASLVKYAHPGLFV